MYNPITVGYNPITVGYKIIQLAHSNPIVTFQVNWYNPVTVGYKKTYKLFIPYFLWLARLSTL